MIEAGVVVRTDEEGELSKEKIKFYLKELEKYISI